MTIDSKILKALGGAACTLDLQKQISDASKCFCKSRALCRTYTHILSVHSDGWDGPRGPGFMPKQPAVDHADPANHG